jgi:hypothetical protein
MKNNIIYFFHCFLCVFCITHAVNVYADIPQTVNFQGFLIDQQSEAVADGTYTITFSIWDGDDESDNKLWQETQNVLVKDGVYSAALATENAFPNTLTFASPYYLGVQFNDVEFLKTEGKFIPLTTIAYAFRSQTSGGRLVRHTATNYSLAKGDDIILAEGNIKITLPSSSECADKVFTIINIGNNTITIETNGSQTIDDDNSASLSTQYDQMTVVSHDNGWLRLGFSKIEPDSIGTIELADSSISISKITGAGNTVLDNGNPGQFLKSNGDGSFSWAEIIIDENEITNTELAPGAVRTSEIVDGSIVATKMSGASNALGNGNNGQLLQSNGDGTFAWGDFSISENEISYTELAAGSVRTEELSQGSIIASKLSGNGSALENGTAGHCIQSNGDGTFAWKDPTIAENEITYTELAAAAVQESELADGAVTQSKIANNSIVASHFGGAPENGNQGASLLSSGDGTFAWGGFTSTQVTIEGNPTQVYTATGNVGIGTTSPSEALDVSGSVKISQVMKLTPLTTAPENPSAGWIYFDSTSQKLKFYNGTAWKAMWTD